MLIDLTDLAAQLAKENNLPVMFMVERLSDLAGELGSRPSLYLVSSGRFTQSGAQVVREHIRIATTSGQLARQLTAFSAA